MSAELLPTPPPKELVVPEDLAVGLHQFWSKWGSSTYSIALDLPDFASHDWEDQYHPRGYLQGEEKKWQKEVQGDRIHVPYYKMEHGKANDVTILKDLIYSAQTGGYGVVIDVGCANSLTPLTVAGTVDQSIVIALDPYATPHDQYPDKYQRYVSHSSEYPYVTKLIMQQPIRNSGAFYFPLNVHDHAVQEVLSEVAWRVQLVSPNPEENRGRDLLDIIFSAAKMVGPGGEMLITGDGFLSGAYTLNNKLQVDSYTTRSSSGQLMRDRLRELHNAFDSFHTLEFTGSDLYRMYGIGDSGWFQTARPVVNGVREKRDAMVGHPPGVAIFRGKK
jgi:hypothetical protein